MMSDYYNVCGWRNCGRPKDVTLGLGWYACADHADDMRTFMRDNHL